MVSLSSFSTSFSKFSSPSFSKTQIITLEFDEIWASVRGRSPKIDRTDLDRGRFKSTDRGRLFGRKSTAFSREIGNIFPYKNAKIAQTISISN